MALLAACQSTHSHAPRAGTRGCRGPGAVPAAPPRPSPTPPEPSRRLYGCVCVLLGRSRLSDGAASRHACKHRGEAGRLCPALPELWGTAATRGAQPLHRASRDRGWEPGTARGQPGEARGGQPGAAPRGRAGRGRAGAWGGWGRPRCRDPQQHRRIQLLLARASDFWAR